MFQKARRRERRAAEAGAGGERGRSGMDNSPARALNFGLRFFRRLPMRRHPHNETISLSLDSAAVRREMKRNESKRLIVKEVNDDCSSPTASRI